MSGSAVESQLSQSRGGSKEPPLKEDRKYPTSSVSGSQKPPIGLTSKNLQQLHAGEAGDEILDVEARKEFVAVFLNKLENEDEKNETVADVRRRSDRK